MRAWGPGGMTKLDTLRKTFAYARLGLVSLAATVAPMTAIAQDLCGADLFAGEPDADSLMAQATDFIDLLASNGVIAFQGREGRVAIQEARAALQDGVGSARLLVCVVEAETIEFNTDGETTVVACDDNGTPSLFQPISRDSGAPARPWEVQSSDFAALFPDTTADGAERAVPQSNASPHLGGALFCTTEVAAFAPYLGSQA